MSRVRVPHEGVGTISRRGLLAGAGVLTGGAATGWLTGCTGSGEPTGAGGDGGPDTGEVVWWDHQRPLTATFEDALFAPWTEAHPGTTVARQVFDAASLGQALQLGRRSDQLPDVHTLAGLDSAPSALVGAGWFQPIDDFVDVASLPVADQVVDGLHRFDGRVYSLPVFSGRVHAATPWLNTELAEGAGIDPQEQPDSWDDLRAVLRRLQTETPEDVHGLLLPSQEAAYLSEIITRLAQAAGAAGQIDWRTGEYAFASDPFLEAVELLQALQADGVVHPASASMGERDARARWAAGEAAVFLWGSWFLGGLLVEEPEAVQRGVAAWQLPSASGGPAMFYNSPSGGEFWVSAQAQRPRLGADLAASVFSPEFMTALASAMVRPPVLEEAAAGADVHPAYRANVTNLTRDVRLAPVPEARTPDVAAVLVQMRAVDPGLGDIVQAVLTGSEADPAGALRRLQEQTSAERERAVEAVVAEGGQVSVADWRFEDWAPGEDHGG